MLATKSLNGQAMKRSSLVALTAAARSRRGSGSGPEPTRWADARSSSFTSRRYSGIPDSTFSAARASGSDGSSRSIAPARLSAASGANSRSRFSATPTTLPCSFSSGNSRCISRISAPGFSAAPAMSLRGQVT